MVARRPPRLPGREQRRWLSPRFEASGFFSVADAVLRHQFYACVIALGFQLRYVAQGFLEVCPDLLLLNFHRPVKTMHAE